MKSSTDRTKLRLLGCIALLISRFGWKMEPAKKLEPSPWRPLQSYITRQNFLQLSAGSEKVLSRSFSAVDMELCASIPNWYMSQHRRRSLGHICNHANRTASSILPSLSPVKHQQQHHKWKCISQLVPVAG